MKKMIRTCAFFACAQFLYSQNKTVENAIRHPVENEVKAVLKKDSAMLLELWDRDY